MDASYPQKCVLAEYSALKTEQNVRIAMRDHILYANIGSIGALCYYSATPEHIQLGWLAISLVSFLLGWTYFSNDVKVTQIRRYIREKLSGRVNEADEDTCPLFGWESYHRERHTVSHAKIYQLLVDLITFVVPGLASAYVYANTTHWSIFGTVIAGGCAILPCTLAMKFLTHFREERQSAKSSN